MALFDPEEMLNMETSGPMETAMTPCLEGEWHAFIKKLEFRSGTSDKGPWAACDVHWEVTDQEVIDATEMEHPTARQSLFLDMVEGGGGLAMGKNKNVQLGKLREALGQNGPEPWSFGMLEGSTAIVRIEHREYNDNTYGEVKSVAAA